MPRESFPAGIRQIVMTHDADFANAATVGPDFNAATLATIAGGAGGYSPGCKVEITKLRFRVGPEDFANAGGTLTFELRLNSATGFALASLTIPLATALRGAVLEAAAVADQRVKLRDTDTLFLVRIAAGTVFTVGRGKFEVEGWQRPQARR